MLRTEKTEEERCKERDEAKERMRIFRSEKTEEERSKERDEATERMRMFREEKTEEERSKERTISRKRMTELRAARTEEDIQDENEVTKSKMRECRSRKSAEEKEYIVIEHKHKNRGKRKQRTGKEHLLENLKAKKGMRILEDEGRLEAFAKRSGRKAAEIDDWEFYFKGNKKNSNFLENKKPDIVQVLNEKVRKEKEKERKRKEEVRERGGEWYYYGEMDEYYWVGEGEPILYDDYDERQQMTKEDLRLAREHEKQIDEDFMKQRRAIQKEKRRQKEKERKEAMNKPVQPLPERELCQYEKIREDNIKERKEAMAKCHFFDDLHEVKKDIGFFRNIKEKEVVENEVKAKEVKKNEVKKREVKEKELKKKQVKEEGFKKREVKKKEVKEKEVKKNEVKNRDVKENELKEKTDNEDLETGVEIKKPAEATITQRTVLWETELANSEYYNCINGFALEY